MDSDIAKTVAELVVTKYGEKVNRRIVQQLAGKMVQNIVERSMVDSKKNFTRIMDIDYVVFVTGSTEKLKDVDFTTQKWTELQEDGGSHIVGIRDRNEKGELFEKKFTESAHDSNILSILCPLVGEDGFVVFSCPQYYQANIILNYLIDLKYCNIDGFDDISCLDQFELGEGSERSRILVMYFDIE